MKHEACNDDLMLALDGNYDRALTFAWSSFAVEMVSSLGYARVVSLTG